MSKNDFLGKIKVLGISFLYIRWLRPAAIQFAFQEIYNVDVLLVRIKLPRVDSEKQVPHIVIADERVVAVACQVEIFLAVVFDDLLLVTGLFQRLII